MAYREPNYVKIAARQKLLILGVLVVLGAQGFTLTQFILAQEASSTPLYPINLPRINLIVLVMFASIMLGLMSAMRKNILAIVLLTLLVFVPMINLIVVALVNGQANTLLRANGIRVGFLGARTDDLDKLDS